MLRQSSRIKDWDSIQILWSSSKGLNRMLQLPVSTRSLPSQTRLYSTSLYGRYVLKKRHVVYVMLTAMKDRYPYTLLHTKKNLSLFLWNIYQAENNFSICFKFTLLFGNTLLWIFQKKMHKGMHINCFGEFINFNRSTQILCHVFYNIHLFTSPDNIEVCFYH